MTREADHACGRVTITRDILRTLVDDVLALKARLRGEVDAHRMTLHPHALPFTDEEWAGYLATIPGFEGRA